MIQFEEHIFEVHQLAEFLGGPEFPINQKTNTMSKTTPPTKTVRQ